MFRLALLVGTLGLFAGCTNADVDAERPLNSQEFKPLLDVTESTGRSVGYEAYGPATSGLSSSTEVWEVSQRWYEVTDEAGIAWAANSGLTWDEKYAAWVDLLDQTQSDDGHVTVELLTPHGRRIPGPRLECAEMAMFLRATFASWYELPFFMSAWSPTYGDMHFGHFGIVDDNGTRISGYPKFASWYSDHTDDMAGMTDADILANWPDDTDLEDKYLTTSKDDYNDFLGSDAYAGAYFDEIFLNKRTGHFLLRLLVNTGSMHLASASNTWNLEPEDIREGDLLIHRWQSSGIGHAMVIKEVDTLQSGNLDAEIIYGSMPRIQPVWYGPAISKSYFTSQYAGGPETNSDGTAYSELGGGIKRWRTPIMTGGRWVNIVPVDDRNDYIGSTDYSALEERIATSKVILGELTPAEERDAILERIRMARENLSMKPASCANRERREAAFDELYDLMTTEFGMTATEVDEEYRKWEDYVFAQLVYTASKTCCWNSSTNAMYEIVLQYNQELIDDAHANNQCVEPVIFMARDGGTYEPFASFADSIGRGDEWVAWSEDESCSQRDVTEDTPETPSSAPFCDVYEVLMGYEDPSSGGDDCDSPTTWYSDDDDDGFGDAWTTTSACDQPEGYVADDSDCNDGDDWSYPGAIEICDGIDNSCDGTVDEGCDSDDGSDDGDSGSDDDDIGSLPGGCACSGARMATPFTLGLLGGLGLFGFARRF